MLLPMTEMVSLKPEVTDIMLPSMDGSFSHAVYFIMLIRSKIRCSIHVEN